MKSISIRNVPEKVYVSLQSLAKANRRSLQEQIKLMLEQEVKLNKRSFLAEAEQWRKRLDGRKLNDTVKMVRRDRER